MSKKKKDEEQNSTAEMLIEQHQLTDCLNLVLEVLRQDAWFYTAYIHTQYSYLWTSSRIFPYRRGTPHLETAF